MNLEIELYIGWSRLLVQILQVGFEAANLSNACKKFCKGRFSLKKCINHLFGFTPSYGQLFIIVMVPAYSFVKRFLVLKF